MRKTFRWLAAALVATAAALSEVYVSSAAFTADGSRLLTLTDSGDLRVWDPRAGQATRELSMVPSAPAMGGLGRLRDALRSIFP